MKIWLKAIKNCTKRGIKSFIESLTIFALMCGAGLMLVGAISILISAITWLLGPTVCAAISGFFEKSAIWIVVGMMVIAIAAMGIDAVVSEKKMLDWRNEH